MHYKYKTHGTCSSAIEFDINGNVVTNVQFFGGCNGNLKAISSFAEGMTVEEIEQKVKGIKCGWKNPSCADQLACAVRKEFDENK